MNDKKVMVKVDFLEKVLDCLNEMIYYADDGIVSRRDPDFQYFFKSVDEARDTSKELNNLLDKERGK